MDNTIVNIKEFDDIKIYNTKVPRLSLDFLSDSVEKFEPSTRPQCDVTLSSPNFANDTGLFTFKGNDGAFEDSYLSELS